MVGAGVGKVKREALAGGSKLTWGIVARYFACSPPRWRGSQVVRQRSAKPLFVGSIPTRASKVLRLKQSQNLRSPRSIRTFGRIRNLEKMPILCRDHQDRSSRVPFLRTGPSNRAAPVPQLAVKEPEKPIDDEELDRRFKDWQKKGR